MNFRGKNYPGIIEFHITSNNHIYISSIVGGYVEQRDNGQYFNETEVQEALEHRQKHIDKAYDEYSGSRIEIQFKPAYKVPKFTRPISDIINPKRKK